MSTFKNISLRPPEYRTRVMAKFFQHFKICFRRTAIITGNNNQGIGGQLIFLNCFHYLSYHIIHLQYKITIRICSALSLKFLCWKNWSMWGWHCIIKEEWFIICSMLIYKTYSLLGQMRQNLFVTKITCCQSFSPPGIFILILGVFYIRISYFVILNIYIRRDIQRCRNTIEIIKTIRYRPIKDGF